MIYGSFWNHKALRMYIELERGSVRFIYEACCNMNRVQYYKGGVINMNLPQVKDELIQFNKMIFLYNAAMKELKLRLDILRDEYKFIHQYDPIYEVKTRIKSIDGITAKLQKKGKEITVENIENYVDDIAGVRICCNYSTDIYLLVDMLMNQKDIEVLKSRDYMNDPKTSGYRGYHMVVMVPVPLQHGNASVKVEVQLRTTAMNSWAILEDVVENAYSDYLPEELMKDMKECADMRHAVYKRLIRIQDEVSQYKNDSNH